MTDYGPEDAAVDLAEREAELRRKLARLTAPVEEGSTIGFGKRIGDGTTQAMQQMEDAGSAQVIAESLELTPFGKALFSSDAFGAAELFHLGALLFRRGLARALDTWAGADWPPHEQQRIATMIATGNARRVYRLDQTATTTFGTGP